MNSAQVVAVMRGEGFSFQQEIAAASVRKETAKYAVLEHQDEHGC